VRDQIVIQAINNQRVGTWSGVAIVSMTVSIYAIVATVYKYACKSRKTARRSVEAGAPAASGPGMKLGNAAGTSVTKHNPAFVNAPC